MSSAASWPVSKKNRATGLRFWSTGTISVVCGQGPALRDRREVGRTHERVHIIRNSREYVVLLAAEDFKSIEATLELLADTRAQERVAAAEADFAAGEAPDEQHVRALTDQLARDPTRVIYRAQVARTAARQLAEQLPEAVAAACVEFLYGPLAENSHRVGAALRKPFEGYWRARRGEYPFGQGYPCCARREWVTVQVWPSINACFRSGWLSMN